MKTTTVYNVSMTLNDGRAMVATLLNKPDSAILAAVAAAQGVSPDFGAVAAVIGDIEVIPGGKATTDIEWLGSFIGEVTVETLVAYGTPPKAPVKHRTPKV